MTELGALSIRTKLIGVLSLFIAALVGLGLFDLHGIRTIHGLMGEVQQNWMPGVRWATALKTGVADARAAAFQHILASDEPGMDLAEKRFAESVAAVAAARREVESRISSEGERTIHSRFDASWASYQRALKEIFAALRLGASHLHMAGDSAGAANLSSVLEFVGAGKGASTGDALEIVRGFNPGKIRYRRPTDPPDTPPELGGVRFFIMGPPPDEQLLKRTNPARRTMKATGSPSPISPSSSSRS